jgi:hypothetical protein
MLHDSRIQWAAHTRVLRRSSEHASGVITARTLQQFFFPPGHKARLLSQPPLWEGMGLWLNSSSRVCSSRHGPQEHHMCDPPSSLYSCLPGGCDVLWNAGSTRCFQVFLHSHHSNQMTLLPEPHHGVWSGSVRFTLVSTIGLYRVQLSPFQVTPITPFAFHLSHVHWHWHTLWFHLCFFWIFNLFYYIFRGSSQEGAEINTCIVLHIWIAVLLGHFQNQHWKCNTSEIAIL